MPVTLKSNDSLRDHLTNFHLTDKAVGESASSSDNYARYTPSKEQMTKIMELVENRTGLKFGKRDLRFFFITREEATKLATDEFSSILAELRLDKNTFNSLLKEVMNTELKNYKISPGHYSRLTKRVYCMPENLEMAVKRRSVEFVQAGVIQGKLHGILRKEADERALSRTTEFEVANTLAHEYAHKILHENNLVVDKEALRLRLQLYRLASKLKGADKKEEEKIFKSIKQINKNIDAIDVFDEAVAYLVEYRVMRDLGFDKEVSFYLKNLMLQNLDIAKGIAFLEQIESIANRNPIPLIYKNLPESMLEIENPRAYLRRTTGWRV